MAATTHRLNFTKAALAALPLPAKGKRATYFDARTRGLHVIITETGTTTFYLRRKHDGRSERILIGRFPEITIEQARGKAGELTAAFATGKNPAEVRRSIRAELTFGDLFRLYVERYARAHTRTWPEMEANFRRYLSHWDSAKLSTITKDDVQRLHAQLGRSRGQHTANRTIELVRAVFNKGIAWELWDKQNPAAAVTKFRLRSRFRFLEGPELSRFFAALAEEPNDTLRDFFLIALLTGARKSNVLAMRWDQINFERAVWTIPETKNGEAHSVALTEVALAILRQRAEALVNEYVFPGEGAAGHLVSPKKAWARLLNRAGIEDLRIHDLRRTMGSWQALTGTSLHIIGKSLGHKDESTTQVYARLTLDPIRKAMETAQQAMFEAAGLRSGQESVPDRMKPD